MPPRTVGQEKFQTHGDKVKLRVWDINPQSQNELILYEVLFVGHSEVMPKKNNRFTLGHRVFSYKLDQHILVDPQLFLVTTQYLINFDQK